MIAMAKRLSLLFVWYPVSLLKNVIPGNVLSRALAPSRGKGSMLRGRWLLCSCSFLGFDVDGMENPFLPSKA